MQRTHGIAKRRCILGSPRDRSCPKDWTKILVQSLGATGGSLNVKVTLALRTTIFQVLRYDLRSWRNPQHRLLAPRSGRAGRAEAPTLISAMQDRIERRLTDEGMRHDEAVGRAYHVAQQISSA